MSRNEWSTLISAVATRTAFAIALRRFAEATVKACDEGGRIRIDSLPCADSAQSKLFDEPVLQRQIGPFHTALGLT